MAQLQLYRKFSKRKNSTKQPGSADYTRDVYMKVPVSMQNPVFILNTVDLDVNYCKFEDHYYFVDDIQLSLNGQYELHCSMDELASHKTTIIDQYQYISRGIVASGGTYDSNIPDNMLSQKQSNVQYRGATTFLYNPDTSSGTIIVGITNSYSADDPYTGSVHYYMMEPGTFARLLRAGMDYTDAFRSYIKDTFLNPIQYIVSAIWYPIDMSDFQPTSEWVTENITLGPLQVAAVQGVKLPLRTFPFFDNGIITLNVPDRYYSDFRDISSNWTSCTLEIFEQVVQVDPQYLYDNLYVYAEVDARTGIATADIRARKTGANNVHIISKVSAQFGVPIPITNTGADIKGIMSGVISTMMSAGASSSLGVAMGVASGVMTAVTSAATGTSTTINGMQGNMHAATSAQDITVTVARKDTCETPIQRVGKPINKYDKPSNYTYVQCLNPSVNIASFGSDKDIINSLLSSGVYIE